MDGQEIFKEILKSPKLKSLIGDVEIDQLDINDPNNKEIAIIKSIIEGELRNTSDEAMFQFLKKMYGL